MADLFSLLGARVEGEWKLVESGGKAPPQGRAAPPAAAAPTGPAGEGFSAGEQGKAPDATGCSGLLGVAEVISASDPEVVGAEVRGRGV